MITCARCDSLSDGHQFCSLEPESWGRSRMVRIDRLRSRRLRRRGLEPTRPFGGVERFLATPTARRDFADAMVAASRPAVVRVVSSETRKIYGHTVDTDPEARVHWRVRGLTVCGREARRVLHTSDQSAVTCKQCTFEV